MVWVTVVVILGATQAMAKFSELGPEPDAASLVSGWSQFDGHEHLNIARVGCSDLNDQGRTRAVWLPAYPLLIRLGDVVVSPQVAAVAWSALLGLLGALGAAVWMLEAGMTRRQVRLAVGSLLVYPYSWFL